MNRIIRLIIAIMKNDKKNRRNKISMTQDDNTVRLMIRMIIIVEMI